MQKKTTCYFISLLAFNRNATRCHSVIICWSDFNGLPVSMNLKSSNIFFFLIVAQNTFFHTWWDPFSPYVQPYDWLISIFARIRGLDKLHAWSSLMLQLLLFQSTERLLIDVESVCVATIGMEEILKLLTERDIEHTNNLPLLSSSYLHSPFLRSNPAFISCQCFSVFGSLSPYIHHMSLSMLYLKDASIYSKAKSLSSCWHKT